VRALNRKLFRDLWQMKAQAFAIIAVIGTGVAMFAMYLSTFDSLDRTQAQYYDDTRFAHVFARCKRAPAWLAERVAEIPQVARVDTRVSVDVTLDVAEEVVTHEVVGAVLEEGVRAAVGREVPAARRVVDRALE